MTKLLATITALALSLLACGVSSTVANTPPKPTNKPANTFTATPASVSMKTYTNTLTPAPSSTPHLLTILGDDTTWNIRRCGRLDCEIIETANGGDQFKVIDIVSGWVMTERGWICGRAFGGSEECQ